MSRFTNWIRRRHQEPEPASRATEITAAYAAGTRPETADERAEWGAVLRGIADDLDPRAAPAAPRSRSPMGRARLRGTDIVH